MKKIDQFVNLYPVTKTLRFRLIPIGKTKENFDKNKLLEIDKERAKKYEQAKRIIDKYYDSFINNCLNNCVFDKKEKNLKNYFDVYNDKELDKDKKWKKLQELEKLLRKEIVDAFKSKRENKEIYEKLFKSDLLDLIIDDKRFSDDEKNIIKSFDGFTTYFTGFFTNRKNVFSDEDKVGSISYRCINDNLKIHIYNINVFKKVKDILSDEINQIEINQKDRLKEFKLDEVFSIDFFELCLTGSDINKYNDIISGYTIDEKTKIQGLNEYINLYNQNKGKGIKFPQLKKMKKQILSEDRAGSFRFDVIEDDKQLHEMLKDFNNSLRYNNFDILNCVKELVNGLMSSEFEMDKVYVNIKKIALLSEKSFGNYTIINSAMNNYYDITHTKGKNIEKYETDKEKYIKSLKNISIDRISKCLETFDDNMLNNEYNVKRVIEILCTELSEAVDRLIKASKDIAVLKSEDLIKGNKQNTSVVKEYLDAGLNFYKMKEYFVSLDGEEVDLSFYSILSKIDDLDTIISIYNKARNYLTKKPYSLDKIKLNFNCSTLLNGWDVNKESSNLGIILLKDNRYYLGIMNKQHNNSLNNLIMTDDEELYKKMNYKLLPGPNKMLPKVFLSKKGIEDYAPSKKIIDNYSKGTHKKGDAFSKKDMQELIEYFKRSILAHQDYSNFHFRFKNTSEYEDISGFYREVSEQGYKITFSDISSKYIDKLVADGDLFLFQIYNKDFSKYSKGAKNLHTLYFEQIFNVDNLKDVVYKLNGEAEVFYRRKSIEYKPTHKKNVPIQNKNTNNLKKTSVFEYDIAKDKRFSEDQFQFHVPITINFKANSNLYNDTVNNALKDCDDNYVIGIDRGERNLIYINVVSEKKGLIEQLSFNNIVNEYNDNLYKTDYHSLLEKREKERDNAKKSWDNIANIKELKEGYISQVVHKICELVEKYDAIIVMEDLNAGFKNSRVKVEKQVYQKFEKMLIDKLNLFINKKYDNDQIGGLLKGYQLTRPYQGDKNMQYQNGFIYYVGPWNTSKIDPTTGFVNLFRLSNYQTLKSKKEFIGKFDSIKYNKGEDVFEFEFDYKNFEYGLTDHIGKWVITSFGKRILTYRNKDKNNNWDNAELFPTEELKTLFGKYDIDYSTGDLRDRLLCIEKKEFYDKLCNILKLILQMRNSITNSDVDYLISPVKNKFGKHYNSDDARFNGERLPFDADSNGAFNIARKGLMIIDRIKRGLNEKLTVISNKEWLEYAQTHLPE